MFSKYTNDDVAPLMARSIPSAPILPGHLSGIFSLLLPHSWEYAKEGQPQGWGIVKINSVFRTLKVVDDAYVPAYTTIINQFRF